VNDLVVTLLNAMTLISILMLVAMGMAIIYGLMNVINLAHGEFVTIGAYTLAEVQAWGGNFWLALILAPIIGYIFGSLVEVVLIRSLYKRPIGIILATWGLGLILQQLLQLAFGRAPVPASSPFSGAVMVYGTEFPVYRLFLIGMAVVLVTACAAVLRFTTFGLDIRAVIQDGPVAESLGINTARVFRRAFGAGAALAALAGALIAPLVVVTAQMGAPYLARSFFVVTIGGPGTIGGVVAGTGIVGGLETLLGHEMPESVSQALVLALAIVLMRFRPNGLLGSTGASK
jgi:branched-chain amino acid transport system permease protein/urea transport system permease protein